MNSEHEKNRPERRWLRWGVVAGWVLLIALGVKQCYGYEGDHLGAVGSIEVRE